MEISNETVIGFLTGTLATIVLKGIVDFIQKRIDYKREIDKTIHLKKLDAAEHAIKGMFKTYQSTLIIATAIENLLERDMDGDFFDSIWDHYFRHMADGEESLLTSPVSLYFTLEDEELWSMEDQKSLFEVYSNVKVLGDQIQLLNEELETLEEAQHIAELEEHIESELREPLKKELRELGTLLVKNSNSIFFTIQKLKAEFKS